MRLIYDMVHDKPNPVLTLLSFWMVLSIGLIDFLVFVSSPSCPSLDTNVHPGLGGVGDSPASQKKDSVHGAIS